MRITLLQTNLIWEDKAANLCRLQQQLEICQGTTDLVVLPEMFTTGFSMHPEAWAESNEGSTLTTLQKFAQTYQTALAGSHMACEQTETGTAYYNRAFFLTPEGDQYFYDKRHLFRMGQESEHFSAGTQRPIITYRGWNILLLVCYDLRFPVWSRNVDNEYDLLIYVANWPSARRAAWDILLPARAIENQCYVCGVNRIGVDGYQLTYPGGSSLYSPKGQLITRLPDDTEYAHTETLHREELLRFREKFPVWKDADSFELHSTNSSRQE